MNDMAVAQARWFRGVTHDGLFHFFEPYRTHIGAAYDWEALCGLYGVPDDRGLCCATCTEVLYDRFADDVREVDCG